MDLFNTLVAHIAEQNTIWFLFGVAILSLLGSTHCLVMCVPIASGLDRIFWYHLGRLISYIFVGLCLYYFTKVFVQSWYYQLGVGFLFLIYFVYSHFHTKKICHVKERSNKSFITGLLNGVLPCGWLYLSLYLFTQKNSIAILVLSILIFWIATLPIFLTLMFKQKFIEKFPAFSKSQVRLGVYILASLIAFSLHFKNIDLEHPKADSLFCLPWK